MTEPGRATSVRHVFWCTLVGVLLLQTAWLMSIPSFRGPDEFDHAYKTAAVAHGELHTAGTAPHGRGGLVSVPRGLVEAASKACESRSYTGHDNCHPVDDATTDVVQVATAAGAYDPAWYAVVGLATRWVSPTHLDLAMRLVGMLLAALLLAAAAATTAAWARTRWPLVALSLAATPTLAYSTVIVSPNGVHYAAAMLAWAGALGLARSAARPDERPVQFLVAVAVGASVMVCTHTTGPMWLALTGLLVLALRPLRWWLGAVRSAPLPWLLAVGVTAVATLASVGWTRAANANGLGAADPTLPAFHASLLVRSEILWPFQTVGAFPMRDDPAPFVVYVVWFTLFLVLGAMAVRRAPARVRWVAVALVALVVTVPAVLTVISFSSNGLAWQGRYALPLSIGMPLLAGWTLDRRPVRMGRHVPLLAAAAIGVAQLASVLHVAAKEMREYPVDPISGTFTGGLLLMALLAVAGPLVSAGLANRDRGSADVEPVRVPVSVA